MVAMVPWYSAVSARPCQVCIVQRVSLEFSLDSTLYSNWILFASVIISMLGQTWFLYKELRQWSFWDPVDPRLGQKSLGPVPLSPLSLPFHFVIFPILVRFFRTVMLQGFDRQGGIWLRQQDSKSQGILSIKKVTMCTVKRVSPSHAWPPPATS